MSAAQHVENFLQLLTAGILTGAIYGLMCVGLSLIFGIMRVINFAQGEFMMLGMYAAWYCFGFLAGVTFFPELIAPFAAALAAGPFVFVLGLVMAVLEGDEDRAKAIVPHAFRAFATMYPENPASKQWVAAVGAQGE